MRLFLLICMGMLSCAAWADTGYVVRPTELKAKPFADAATLVNLPEHITVELLARQMSWMNVKAPSGTGWVKMLSLRLGSPGAPGKKVDTEANKIFDVVSTANSRSNTGTVVKGLSNGGANIQAIKGNADSEDTIQADEIYESDQPDDTYDNTKVIAAKMWGGSAGKLRNAHPNVKALEAIAGFSAGKSGVEKTALVSKLSKQHISYFNTKNRKPSDDTDQAVEISLGDSIVANLLGGAPLLPSKKAQQYVNNVGLWLAMQTERPELPWKFAVLDSDEIFAFSAPGGGILITRGLLQRLRSEEELAGVLAQEIAHVVGKHHFWAIKKRAGSSSLATLKEELSQQTAEKPTLTKLSEFGAELYAQGLKIEYEFEADAMAVVIAARAGYDPFGLPSALQTLQTIKPSDPNIALLQKTHPALSERLDALEKLMTAPFSYVENQPNFSSRYKVAMSEIEKK